MIKGQVSVIIPIYNAEKFLSKCIGSVVGQTYKKIQIILVNDGSTDRTEEICNDFAKKDNRIAVINQKNQGNTAARKTGLAYATGEYVTFVDADDYISEHLVKRLYSEINIEKADLICCNVEKIYSYGSVECKSKIKTGSYSDVQEIIANMFYYKDTNEFGILPYLCAKLYKRDYIVEGLSELDNQVQYAEDRAMMFWCMIHANKVIFIDDILYYYVIHEGSICNSQDELFLNKLTSFYLYVKKLFEKEEQRDRLLTQLDKYMVNTTIHGLNEKIGLSQKNLVKKYYLDESMLEKSKKVVLYGAGAVGKDYYRQLKSSTKIQVCAWVDTNYETYAKQGLAVESIDVLGAITYDYIIVAVLHENIFENILETLNKYVVQKDKIVWGKPYTLF